MHARAIPKDEAPEPSIQLTLDFPRRAPAPPTFSHDGFIKQLSKYIIMSNQVSYLNLNIYIIRYINMGLL